MCVSAGLWELCRIILGILIEYGILEFFGNNWGMIMNNVYIMKNVLQIM